ncbi:MAG TPA: hypothetical protein VG900_17495 [Hyphomicrobiaceae bacterium]|nr:hypothetical protein [Hyphomicrobiaceae bacterium]
MNTAAPLVGLERRQVIEPNVSREGAPLAARNIQTIFPGNVLAYGGAIFSTRLQLLIVIPYTDPLERPAGGSPGYGWATPDVVQNTTPKMPLQLLISTT